MKNIIPLLTLMLVPVSAEAAITVIISPSGSGTRFTITQEGSNPILTTDQVTGGALGGIPLAKQSILQDPALYALEPGFASSPGSFTKTVGTGGSLSTITRLFFAYSMLTDGISPVLSFDVPLNVPPGGNHQFTLSPTAGGDVVIDFSYFVPGTTVESWVTFGTVTTIVVPEAGSVLLGFAGLVGMMVRRRR